MCNIVFSVVKLLFQNSTSFFLLLNYLILNFCILSEAFLYLFNKFALKKREYENKENNLINIKTNICYNSLLTVIQFT